MAQRAFGGVVGGVDAGDAAYEARKASGLMRDGRRIGTAQVAKPYTPPAIPQGKVNTTDPDSRNVKTPRGWVQGYNAQIATNAKHIVIAAWIASDCVSGIRVIIQ